MRLQLSLSFLVTSFLFGGVAHAQTTLMQVDGIRRGDTLNVRTGPGASYKDIGDLQAGEIVTVLGYDASGRWAKVRYRGQIAYASARYLTTPLRTDGRSADTGAHRVIGIKAGDPDGGLVMRDGAGTSFARIGVLTNGTEVYVIQRSADQKWAMIALGSGVGWVSAAYLKSTQSTGQNQSTGQSAPEPMPDSSTFTPG